MLVRGLWPHVASIDLRGMTTVEEVRAAVARSTGLSEADIHIGRRDTNSEWGWTMMEDADAVKSQWMQLEFFAVERFEDLKQTERMAAELYIYSRYSTRENVLISSYYESRSVIMCVLSVLEGVAGRSAVMAEPRRILRLSFSKFYIEWNVDTATDLKSYLFEKDSTLCQRKWWCVQICAAFKWFWDNELDLYGLNSGERFFVDAAGDLKCVPHKFYYNRSRDTFSDYIRQCGLTIELIFTGDAESLSTTGELNEAVDTDLVELARHSAKGEIATFGALIRSDYLDMTGSVTLSDSVNADAAPLLWSVIYSHKGLDIVDTAASKLCVDASNIFIYEEDKLIQGGAVLDYKKERSLTFLILASISGFVKADQKPLGAGAYAKVFVFEETLSGHKYAMKKFKSAIIKSDSLKSFLAEIRVVKKIEHPNIVKYYDVYHEKRKSIFLQMELMQESLGAVVRRSNGGLPIGEVKFFSLQILAGLEYLHSIPIIHRDLKCDNVLIQDRRAKLTDFGLAKEILMSKIHEPVEQSQVGTVYTMAPEIINSDPYDSSIDIWSFGGILWEMAAGRHSYSRLKETQQIIVIAREKVLEYNPQFPEELQLLIQLCTKKDPKERPTAAALMEDEFFKISPE